MCFIKFQFSFLLSCCQDTREREREQIYEHPQAYCKGYNTATQCCHRIQNLPQCCQSKQTLALMLSKDTKQRYTVHSVVTGYKTAVYCTVYIVWSQDTKQQYTVHSVVTGYKASVYCTQCCHRIQKSGILYIVLSQNTKQRLYTVHSVVTGYKNWAKTKSQETKSCHSVVKG